MQNINLKNEIAHYYHEITTFYPTWDHLILESGRGVTKSTRNAIQLVLNMLHYDGVDVLVCVYEFGTSSEKVLQDIVKAIDILKIPKNRYIIKDTSNEIYVHFYCPTGKTNHIIFDHLKDGSDRVKGRRPLDGNKWINWWFYELTNFRNLNFAEMQNICVTPFRAEAHNDLYIMYEFNTPKKGTSGFWVDEWRNKMISRTDTKYIRNNYLSMTEEEKLKFITPKGLEQIKNLREIDYLTYQYVYEGIDAYTGDRIYYNIDTVKHYGLHENFYPDTVWVGCDVGRQDAFSLVCRGYEHRGKPLRVQDYFQWYHSGRKGLFEKNDERNKFEPLNIKGYAEMIWDFLNMVHDKFPDRKIYFQMDYANEGQALYDLIEENNQPIWLDYNRRWKKDNIEQRITWHLLLFGLEGCYMSNVKRILMAFGNQTRDKNGKREDNPANKILDMDTIDSVEYTATELMITDMITLILKNKGGHK